MRGSSWGDATLCPALVLGQRQEKCASSLQMLTRGLPKSSWIAEWHSRRGWLSRSPTKFKNVVAKKVKLEKWLRKTGTVIVSTVLAYPYQHVSARRCWDRQECLSQRLSYSGSPKLPDCSRWNFS